MNEKVPILVVLGTDTEGKWHASRFDEREATLVTRAAALMGFDLVRVPADDAELYGIAETLPVGKIFASGKAFVPFVARAAFDKLRAVIEGGVISDPRAPTEGFADQPSAEMFTTDAIGSADALWSKIEVGTTVLADQPDVYGPGWWKGIVVGVDGDDLTIRWVDEATLEPIHVSRRHVALRHPSSD
jgi:hypothetical protein